MPEPKISWLIEKEVFDDGTSERIADIVKSLGLGCKIIDNVAFHGGLGAWAYSELFPEDDSCVIAYGSINLCMRLREAPWTPTAWFPLWDMRCSSYYAHWGRFLLQQEYAFLPWAELPRRKGFLLKALGKNGSLFVRPDSNAKTFTGTVVHKEKFEHWVGMTQECYSPTPDSLVVVARPRTVLREWRFIVRRGEVVAGSLYKDDGESRIASWSCDPDPHSPASLALAVAKDPWQPAPIYVVDVCEVPGDQRFRLLEMGSANCAALYGCDLDRFVQSCNAQAKADWLDIHGEQG